MEERKMTDDEVILLFKCLADKTRLQILKSLTMEDMYVERLSERLGLSASTISFHLKKLTEIGAVRSYKNQYYTMYSLCKEVFQKNILDLLQTESEDAALQKERDAKYREKVIASFFEYGKLKSIPAQRKKLKIALEEIVKSFEFNHEYTEREVNIIIADYNDDFCTLRRAMVSEQLLERDEKGYRRVGKLETEQ